MGDIGEGGDFGKSILGNKQDAKVSENKIKRLRGIMEKSDAKDFIMDTSKTPVEVNEQCWELADEFIKL